MSYFKRGRQGNVQQKAPCLSCWSGIPLGEGQQVRGLRTQSTNWKIMKLVHCDCYRGDSAAKQRDSGAWARAEGEISLHTRQGVGLHVIAPVKSGWFASVMTAAEQRMSLIWDNTKLDQKTGRQKSPNFLTQDKYSVPRCLHCAGTPGAGRFISTHIHPFLPSKEHWVALRN